MVALDGGAPLRTLYYRRLVTDLPIDEYAVDGLLAMFLAAYARYRRPPPDTHSSDASRAARLRDVRQMAP